MRQRISDTAYFIPAFIQKLSFIPVQTLIIKKISGIEFHIDTPVALPFALGGLFHLEQLTIYTEPNLWHTTNGRHWFHQDVIRSDVIWSPFIPLAAKCSSLSITVYTAGSYRASMSIST